MDDQTPRRRMLGSCLALCLSTLAACSQPKENGSEQASVSTTPTASTDYSALARNTVQVQAGKKVFSNCAVCHSAEAGVPSPAGPALAGVLGRKIGGVADYPYSQALAKAEGSWTPEKLDAFLKNPMEAYPGTAMAFGGLTKDSDRKAVIAYLAGTAKK
jgi:cytochrome c